MQNARCKMRREEAKLTVIEMDLEFQTMVYWGGTIIIKIFRCSQGNTTVLPLFSPHDCSIILRDGMTATDPTLAEAQDVIAEEAVISPLQLRTDSPMYRQDTEVMATSQSYKYLHTYQLCVYWFALLPALLFSAKTLLYYCMREYCMAFHAWIEDLIFSNAECIVWGSLFHPLVPFLFTMQELTQ
jgi:hypothetical protein